MFQQLNDCKVVLSLHYSSTSRHHIISVISDRLTARRHKRKGFISLLGNKVASEDKLGFEKVYEINSKLEFCLRHLREISLRTSAHPHVFPSLYDILLLNTTKGILKNVGVKRTLDPFETYIFWISQKSVSHTG